MSVEKYDVGKLLGLRPEQLPRHIAIIMDGNGRWAQERGLPRFHGHRQGAKVVSATVLECSKLGIQCLTLYSFSTENWRRPRDEVDMLMHLCAEYLVNERDNMMKYGVRLVHVGRRENLPPMVVSKLQETIDLTAANTGMTLALALNYSSRVEITEAVRRIATEVARGDLRPEDITEETLSSHLFTAGLPDPDLLIRTASEYRLSNFLLWQLSYTEFHIAKVYWPDFRASHLRRAIKNYAGRDRRFGAIKTPAAPA